MTNSNVRYITYAALLLFILSINAFVVNSSIYHFPGNNYCPPYSRALAYCLLIMYGGCLLQFGKSSSQIKMLQEFMLFFLVIAVIAIATNAVQYTPFPAIDKKIVSFETALHINIGDIISWTYSKSTFRTLLKLIYRTLPLQLTYIPLFVILAKRWHYIHEYYFLLLISTIIGFSFYYFFPTTAPASIISNNHFSGEQYATGLKFAQIHQHIQPTTMAGGMISLPSFHVVWAWFCLYLLRGWPVLFMIMLPINLLLVASCVLLGWHYPIDILGGIFIIFISHYLYHCCNTTTKRKSLSGRMITLSPAIS